MSGEGRVYVRGGRWWMDWTDGGGVRHRRSLGLPDGAKEGKAKRALAAYRAEVEAERAVRGSGLLERLGLEAAPSSGEVPFSGLAQQYLEHAKLSGKKPLTIYRARLDVRAWLFPYFEHTDARTLDAAALAAFQRHLAATPHRHGKLLAPQSVNGIMATLRAVLHTFTVSAHEGRYFVTDGDHTIGDFATYEEAVERALELESDLDAESERFGDHADPGDYDGDHITGLASVYGDDW